MVTVFFLARAEPGPEGTCVVGNRFGRLLDDSHVDFADFISYELRWQTLHDVGTEAILMSFTMPEQAYEDYFSPGVTIPDTCCTTSLEETMSKIFTYYVLNDGSLGSVYARDLITGLGYDEESGKGFWGQKDWPFWKDFMSRLDSGSEA
jgi:hypothetical protein